ncbi:major facilitator superfamily domain-containing protein [Aspergillus venezuelensis]
MAIDRTNVSGVLTSTFLSDTNMTHDQANTGVLLLWFGIVLLEISSNIVLHRIGPHYWIPGQVIVWGIVEVLQSQVKNASGWYAARLFLRLAESGFISGGLYTLSRWYASDELTKRTAILFLGPSISSAFGSLISAGALRLHGYGGLTEWQCFKHRGWLSTHEADILIARQTRRTSQGHHTSVTAFTMIITRKDIISVLLHWATWPYLITCLSGLQCVNGLSTWGTTIIKSLGFSSIRANLLNAPGSLLGAFFGILLSGLVDGFQRFGHAVVFARVWTMAGLIALYGCFRWQPINVTWLSRNFKTPQQRAVAYAVYIGSFNLGGTYGKQVFQGGDDAPRYRTAWIACISLGAVWLFVTILQIAGFKWANFVSKRDKGSNAGETRAEEAVSVDSPRYVW